MVQAQTIVQAWLARCRAAPRQTALRHKHRGIWHTITWQHYHDAVLRITLALARVGVARGGVISIVSESRPEWLYADLAAQALGCVSHGVYPTCSTHRIGDALRQAGADVVFVEHAQQAEQILNAQPCALRLIVILDARGLHNLRSDRVVGLATFMGTQAIRAAERRRFEDGIANTHGDDVACLCSTAGSGGVARLAAITHAAALRRARAMQAAFDPRADDRTLCFVPLANAAERLFSAVLPLMVDIVVYFPENPATVMRDLRAVQPDWIHAPPRFWEKLLARTECIAMLASPMARRAYVRSCDARRAGWITTLARHHLRHAMGLARARIGYSGGAAASPALRRWFAAIGMPLLDVYESAQTCGPAVRLAMADARGDAALQTEVRVGPQGELMLRTTAQFVGYWAGKTLVPAPCTQDGWFNTGDAAHAKDEGLEVTGRLGSRFTTREGSTLLPETIERELHANPYIAHALVFDAQDGQCSCLLALEMDNILAYAQSQAIPFVDFSHLVDSEAIQSLLHGLMEDVNLRLDDGVRIARFSVIPPPSDEAMTPTLRLLRAMTIKDHATVAIRH